jgi:protein EFR3
LLTKSITPSNVQVTLQIIAALIEKSPKDLPLFAQNVIKVLSLVLRSNDITMVEASLPTFETFCEHHDATSLFADQAYVRQYQDIVRAYATFASTRQTPGKGIPSKPVAVRWRNAGLTAIKSVAESDALASVAGRQLDIIVPMILENLWTDNENFLDLLIHRMRAEEKVDTSNLLRRRTSISTVKTAEEPGDTNPIALSGSAADADALAEEETGLFAMQCLKQIFIIPNRAQLHGATQALLTFIRERIQQKETVLETDSQTLRDSGWAVKIYELTAKWAPVQDRYVILVTALDALTRIQPTEENMREQIVLVAIMSSLLRSEVNLIGLSIMDVLVGLIQQMKWVLKQSGQVSQGKEEKSASDTERTQPPSTLHLELLGRIQRCIGDLATHVYYADQISDMISAILSRLKPHPSMLNASPSIERVENQPAPGTSAGSLVDDQQHLDAFFAFDFAKAAALKAIKAILLVANPRTKISGNVSLTRNKVPVQVWEGTHWLLRDQDGQVRKAYGDAIITWLDRETTRADLIARDEAQKPAKAGGKDMPPPNFARRAVSSASAREKPTKVPRSHFLQLLHLSIYDNALQFVEYENDIVLCHALLAKLVSKLGVNAVRYGLPMVFRLQEDIQEAETPLAKVRLGALCHGYFWAVVEKFDFDASPVGQAIQNEIVRRRSKQFWIDGIQIPPPPLDLIGLPGAHRPQPKMPVDEVESEALLPFDERPSMVDCICDNYHQSEVSPPTSPSASPGRSFAHPILSSSLSTIPAAEASRGLPVKFREDMLTEWTREAAANALREGSKSASLDGSKTNTIATRNNRLAVHGHLANGQNHSGMGSPVNSHHNLRPASHAGGLGVGGLRKSSIQSRVSARSTSSRGVGVASVDQLKSILTGDAPRPPTLHTVRDDYSSESMASFDYTPSELSYNPNAGDAADQQSEPELARSRSKSRERKASGDLGGPLTSHPTNEEVESSDEVPPVPPIPSSVTGNAAVPAAARPVTSTVSAKDHALKTYTRSIKSRGGEGIGTNAFTEAGSPALDLQSLLKGIDSKSREHTLGNLTRPPY